MNQVLPGSPFLKSLPQVVALPPRRHTIGSGMHELAARELLSGPIEASVTLRCALGRVWLTLAGSREDIVLEAGEQRTLPADRRVVIEALEPSRLHLGNAAA